MTGVLFFEVFEIEGWEIKCISGWGYGVAEIVMQLDVLGCHWKREDDGY